MGSDYHDERKGCLNILIVEDERVAARRIERLVRDILGEKVTTIVLVETLNDAEIYLKKKQIDLLFLDLNLNGENGFELLKKVVSESFQTIVVSANIDRAIEAYEYGVLDFIPKPFDMNRMVKALERLELTSKDSQHSANVLVVKNHGRLQLIPIGKVHFIKGAGDYSEIHLHDGTNHLHSKSLEALGHLLPDNFVRIHKSYIADLKQITNLHIHGGGKYECELLDGTKLPVSRTRYKELTSMLQDI